jgi:hypothetical protein
MPVYQHITGIWDNGATPTGEPARPQTLRLVANVASVLRLSVFDPSGAPMDLSDPSTTIALTARELIDSPGVLFHARSGVVTGLNTVEIAIGSADTQALLPGRYVYDVWMSQGADAQQIVAANSFLVLASLYAGAGAAPGPSTGSGAGFVYPFSLASLDSNNQLIVYHRQRSDIGVLTCLPYDAPRTAFTPEWSPLPSDPTNAVTCDFTPYLAALTAATGAWKLLFLVADTPGTVAASAEYSFTYADTVAQGTPGEYLLAHTLNRRAPVVITDPSGLVAPSGRPNAPLSLYYDYPPPGRNVIYIDARGLGDFSATGPIAVALG